MDLPPSGTDPAKDPGGANGQVEGVRPVLEPPALAADRVEDLIRFVQGVVVELDPQPRRAAKDPLVHRADLVPAALDPAERIVHRRVARLLPVLGHEREVARVQRAVELGERLPGLPDVPEIFPSRDGLTDQPSGGGHRSPLRGRAWRGRFRMTRRSFRGYWGRSSHGRPRTPSYRAIVAIGHHRCD